MTASRPILPGFTLDRLLGRGGSGEVWSARVEGSGDRVALKFLTQVSPRAATEAALLETLDHPHLVRLIGMLPTATGSVLVLDLADGGSLADLLSARGRLAVGEVVTALSPIAMALAHAHLNGVVHADVTPGNVLFTAGGLPLLADLGLARLTGDREALNGTRCTPEYVDPSVANGSVPTAASDVFMLAAVAVHALTGAPLWAGATSQEVFAAAEAADLTRLAERLRAAAVPDAVAALLVRATDLDPMKRGGAAAFGLDLRQAAQPVPVELAAGRLRASEPRTALSDVAAGDAGRGRGAGRHAAAPANGPAQIFTRMVAPRPRPALPDRSRRRRLPRVRWAALSARSRAVAGRRLSARWSAAIAFLLAALGSAGVAWAVVGTDSDGSSPAVRTSAAAAPGLPQNSATDGTAETLAAPGSTPTVSALSSGAPPPALTADQAAAALTGLDALRQQAFAKRIPLLLTGVYPTGALLNSDTRLLEQLVPAGCGLQGVQTTYGQVRVAGQGDGTVVVTANAALHESYLVCDGKITAKAPGTPAQALRITLVWRGNCYLISDIVRA